MNCKENKKAKSGYGGLAKGKKSPVAEMMKGLRDKDG